MANNNERFDNLYRRYYDRTVKFFLDFGFSRENARDLAQDTFVRVYKGMNSYRGDAEWGFIEKVARNVALNKIREAKTRKRGESKTVAAEDTLLNFADQKPSPEDQAAIQETLDRSCAAIRSLPEDKRECMRLRLGGYSYGEIAASLGISEDKVKSRLHEARRELKLKGIELP